MPSIEPTSLAGRPFVPVHLFNNKTASLDAARAYIDTQLDGVIAQAIRDAWIVVEASPGAEDASAFILVWPLDDKDIRVLTYDISTLPDGVVINARPVKGQINVTCMGHSVSLVINNDGEAVLGRSGVRVMRCRLDGSVVRTLVCNGETDGERKDGTRHCVGVAVDTARGCSTGHRRAPQRANKTLYTRLPEPIGLELNTATQTFFYWKDRDDPPLGNMLSRGDVSAPLDPGATAKGPSAGRIVAAKFHETIGLSLDLPGRRAFFADLIRSVYAVDLDSGREVLIEDAGIVYCEV
ncbi:hypothetical protein FIBSPDRAFT_954163 [Athelia psychrophila]|uniref:Uncharacterized protein n=1 Tax=Athelia psychrophila TaxID=1759441 RepID=A0A166JL76_9AGAM|nr:hypothetical protein FIBSPDRAFT_954163 [Fibularhizoctonia sp. CBS 109695]